jgi:formate-dependent nitrite reductase cytochrome c552 subunit
MTTGDTGVLYNFANETEISTYLNGIPIDTNTTTKNTALYPRMIQVNPDPYGSDNLTGAGSKVITSGTLAHSATTVKCVDCHSEYLNNTPDEIHEAFLKYGMEQNSNDNCVACHTSTAISINWTRPSTIAFETNSDGTNITINRTYMTKPVRIETFGTQSADVFAVSNATVI